MGESSVVGCGKCLKYFLIIFNFLSFLVGGTVLTVGLYTLLTDFGSDEAAAILGSDIYKAGSYTLAAGGGIILIVSLCGCCGSIKEDRGFLCCYFVVFICLLTVFIAAGVLGFVFRNQIINQVQIELETRLKYKYGVDLNSPENQQFTESWDKLQRKLMCCGITGDINSTESWAFYKLSDTKWYQQFSSGVPYVPSSCCDPAGELPKCDGTMALNGPPSLGPPINSSMVMNEALYPEGCYDKLQNSLEMNSLLIGGFALATLVVMVIGILFSICLFRQLGGGHMV
ncbi:hypothetical protein SNE40_012467 [Patella caerulea]|uniref:Tetraspanin n=1 Tax=Patella caerulea TaxID=87958 RepID=A0AAN8PVY9_PATCE